MGFTTKRFKKSGLKPDLICSVCRGVFEDPVQRIKCKHVFCRECIAECLKRKKVCPVDRQPLTPKGLKDAPQSLKKLLANLDIACDFAAEGCRGAVKLDQLEGHRKDCGFAPEAFMKCEQDCGSSFQRKDKGHHCCLTFLKGLNKELEEKQTLMETEFKVKEQKMREEKKRMDQKVESMREKMEKEKKSSQKEKKETLIAFKQKRKEMKEEINALNKEVHRLQDQKQSSQHLVKILRKDVTRLEDEVKALALTQGQSAGQPLVFVDIPGEDATEKFNRVTASVNRMTFLWFPQKSEVETLFAKWAPHLTDVPQGLKVLCYESSQRWSSACEWLFLALMVGSKGHVTVINPNVDQVNQVKEFHENLITSGRLNFEETRTVEGRPSALTCRFLFDTYRCQKSTFANFSNKIKVGGIVFSGDNVYQKRANRAVVEIN